MIAETHSWVLDRLRRQDDLDREDLVWFATTLGRDPTVWRHLVRHDPGERFFVQLYRDTHLDVWLICWLYGHDTGYHDHDVSSGAVYVCEGALAEDRFHYSGRGFRDLTRTHPAGTAFDFDAAYIHRLRHVGDEPATSIHAYSPALWRMGYYERDANGDLCRRSITYAEEIGPIRPVP